MQEFVVELQETGLITQLKTKVGTGTDPEDILNLLKRKQTDAEAQETALNSAFKPNRKNSSKSPSRR